MKLEETGESFNGRPVLTDHPDVLNAFPWLTVLASPRLYRGLGRTPTREHLLHMLDIFIAYVGHDGRYFQPSFTPVPYERRAPPAAKLRALLEAWTPPELPSEITETARELLYAEGLDLAWDNQTIDTMNPDLLLWPEGVPALIRYQAEKAARDSAKVEERAPVEISLGTDQAVKDTGGCANGRPVFTDYSDVLNTTFWLMVLASPPLYRTLGRTPIPEHLVHLMDIYIAYAARDGRYSDVEHKPVPYERRGPLAAKLRALLETWTPPELPREITEAARDLLFAEGRIAPDGGWDKATITGPDPLEDILLWPEGIPALLREQAEELRKRGG